MAGHIIQPARVTSCALSWAFLIASGLSLAMLFQGFNLTFGYYRSLKGFSLTAEKSDSKFEMGEQSISLLMCGIRWKGECRDLWCTGR
jgi:hypothetical protein